VPSAEAGLRVAQAGDDLAGVQADEADRLLARGRAANDLDATARYAGQLREQPADGLVRLALDRLRRHAHDQPALAPARELVALRARLDAYSDESVRH